MAAAFAAVAMVRLVMAKAFAVATVIIAVAGLVTRVARATLCITLGLCMVVHATCDACARSAANTGPHHGARTATDRLAHCRTGSTTHRTANHGATLVASRRGHSRTCCAADSTTNHGAVFATDALPQHSASRCTSTTAQDGRPVTGVRQWRGA